MSGSSMWLFESGFPTQALYAPFISPTRTTCPAYFILLDFITLVIFGEEYRSLSSLFLHSPVPSFLLGPNIIVSILFSNNRSLRSSLNMTDQVSNPYKAVGKIIIPYILMFIFLDFNLEDRRSYTE